MATLQSTGTAVTPDTLITIKVLIDGTNRRFKLPLHDLGAQVLPQKLRTLLDIPQDHRVVFERYSDSAASFVTLDSDNPARFKQLYRAAKAKLKLRLRATVIKSEIEDIKEKVVESLPVPCEKQSENRSSYLETVLSQPEPVDTASPAFTSLQSSQPPCMDWATAFPGNPAVIRCQHSPEQSEHSASSLPVFLAPFTITCNNCNHVIPNAHYHCGICDQGDFDLCQACIDKGVSCDGSEHWLIKRTIFNGGIIPSVTETLPPKKSVLKEEVAKPVDVEQRTRTCNGCIRELSASEFLTCKNCPDFDLCFICFEHSEHGHHPGHLFEPVEKSGAAMDSSLRALCKPGRNHQHEALCDGCEQRIMGVRHKCLSCPDWDFCNRCIITAAETHPGHRFARLYDSLRSLPVQREFHRGIYCDGPLCAARSRKIYIRGDRYKCAVCHDTDFCANCEAHPSNKHNRTHPLIKLKTAIRNVTISTVNELESGQQVNDLGDRPLARHASTETEQVSLANAATQVHTVAEVKPVEVVSNKTTGEASTASDTKDLDAHFESESTPDGTTFAPDHLVLQSWTLRNPGPRAWPAGCSVYYIGGDDMRNHDVKRPSSIDTLENANHSNTLETGVEPGQTATFSVMLRSPLREGRAISYWRLKTAQGVPFGHKLWVDVTVKAPTVELPIRSAPPTGNIPQELPEVNSEATGSTMIFPKLEKESPASSVHKISANGAQSAAAEKESEAGDDQDLFEDVESVELDVADSDEEAFMTDEEYDILDASDEDLIAPSPGPKN